MESEFIAIPTDANGQMKMPEEVLALPDGTRIELRNLVGGVEEYLIEDLKDDTWPIYIERFTHYRVME